MVYVVDMETHGVVHGRQVELEESVPSLEGKRVRVRLEVLEDEKSLSHSDQIEIWRKWAESGPQGPIEDDGEGWP